MKFDIKNIHIGDMIKQGVKEKEIESERICNFLKCSEKHLDEMYISQSLDSEILLRWSKLLEYDLFRIYSQHLILYAPQSSENKDMGKNPKKKRSSTLPHFRKNIYTQEIIDFILELVETGEKTKNQIIEEYRIPKTTLYKWMAKYKK